jgi:hypothetical protein
MVWSRLFSSASCFWADFFLFVPFERALALCFWSFSFQVLFLSLSNSVPLCGRVLPILRVSGYWLEVCSWFWPGFNMCGLIFADISELNLAKTIAIHFPNGKDNLLSFEITIRPDEGYYQWVLEPLSHLFSCSLDSSTKHLTIRIWRSISGSWG